MRIGRRAVLSGVAGIGVGMGLAPLTRTRTAHADPVAPNGRYLTNVSHNYPCAVDDGHGQVVFGLGPGGRAYHRYQTVIGGSWSAWEEVKPGGPVLSSRPVPIVAYNGAFALFAKTPDDALLHTWQPAPGGQWVDWILFGTGVASPPAVVMHPSGAMALFVRDRAGNLLHRWQNGPGAGWSGWIAFEGGTIGRPAPVVTYLGGMAVFARRSDGQLVHKWQPRSGGAWTPGWTPLPLVLADDPTVVMNPVGGLAVFGRNRDGKVGHIWQTGLGGNWAGPITIAPRLGIVGRPSVLVGAFGGMAMFAWTFDGNNSRLIHCWQNGFGDVWTDWIELAQDIFGEPSAVMTATGVIGVYAHNANNTMVHRWQSGPGEGFDNNVVFWPDELRYG